MKKTLYLTLGFIILVTIGYYQNEYGTSMANKKVKHPYLENAKKSLGISK